jgi:septum formation protein
MKYILASASPRRKELLSIFIKDFEVIPTNVDETMDEAKSILGEIQRIARLKAESVYGEKSIIIAADTVVVKDGVIYGKPKNADDAINTLKILNNSTHSVFTAVCMRSEDINFEFMEETKVTFYNSTENILKWYVSVGEAMDCAGAYAIQGQGAILVEKIDGDYNNVVGLPIARLMRELLK